MNKSDLIEKAKLTDEEIRIVTKTIYPLSQNLLDAPLQRAVAQAQLNKLLNTVVKEAGICPDCEGKGEKGKIIPDRTAFFDGHVEYTSCPTCHGTGRTPEKTVRDILEKAK